MDLFDDHKEEIEKSIHFAIADLMNVHADLIVHDTTSLHFEVNEEE